MGWLWEGFLGHGHHTHTADPRLGRPLTLLAGDPVDLSVAQSGSRAIYDRGHTLKGRTVRLTGFVRPGNGDRWYVTRLLVSCCAADAATSKVESRGADAAAWPAVLDAKAARHVGQTADPCAKRGRAAVVRTSVRAIGSRRAEAPSRVRS